MVTIQDSGRCSFKRQRPDSNKQSFALEFVQRPRFASAFPATMGADEFVLKLDQNAGGVLTEAEKASLFVTLRVNPADATRRARVRFRALFTLVSRRSQT